MAQAPAKVDFAADVLPIFRQNCMGCHGPALQQGGLRLDRKSSVVKPFSRRVRPGSSANSFVYHRVSGTEYGPQMPQQARCAQSRSQRSKTGLTRAPNGLTPSPTKRTCRPQTRWLWQWWNRCATVTWRPSSRLPAPIRRCSTGVGRKAPLLSCTRPLLEYSDARPAAEAGRGPQPAQ